MGCLQSPGQSAIKIANAESLKHLENERVGKGLMGECMHNILY